MSNAALTWAFPSVVGSPGAHAVLVALADHGSDHKGEDWTCFPAVERLMEFTEQAEKTVRRHLDFLVAEGWISRRPRSARGRREAVYDYWLHRDPCLRVGLKVARWFGGGDGPPVNLTAGRAAGHASTTGQNDRRSKAAPPANLTGGYLATTGQIDRRSDDDHRSKRERPPVNLDATTGQFVQSPLEPPYTAEPPVNPHEPPHTEGVREAFDRVGKAWSSVDRDRFAEGRDWPVWLSACEAIDVDRLEASAMRFLAESGEVKRRRLVNLDRWLRERRWTSWPAVVVGGVAPHWRGPAEVRDRVVAALGGKGEDFARAYLDPATWDEERRGIVPANGFAAQVLARSLRPLIGGENGLKILEVVKG